MNLTEIYERFDKEAEAFAGRACLSCPVGCGDCCENADVEVTRSEADLIASYVKEQKPDFEDRLRDAISDPKRSDCIFYDGANDKHCMVYLVRPLTCRAFGYSTYSRTPGKNLIPICPSMPIATGNVIPVLSDPHPPIFGEYLAQIDAIENRTGARKLPLSKAFASSLESLSK